MQSAPSMACRVDTQIKYNINSNRNKGNYARRQSQIRAKVLFMRYFYSTAMCAPDRSSRLYLV